MSDIVICPSSFIDRLPFDGLAMSEDIRPSYVISDYNITYDLVAANYWNRFPLPRGDLHRRFTRELGRQKVD